MNAQPDPSAVTSDLLRSVIREVLQDVVAGEVAAATGARRPVPAGTVVRISSQADLDAAIRRVLADSADPRRRAEIESGRVRFQLATGAPATPGHGSPTGSASTGSASAGSGTLVASAHRIVKGPLTERHVLAAARETTVIIIGERVVVTPLARERARATGVEIRRER